MTKLHIYLLSSLTLQLQSSSHLMFKFNFHRQRTLVYHLNTTIKEAIAIASPTPTLKCYLLLQHHPSLSPVFLRFCTTASDQHNTFTVSYLINNCAFSPETALKASKRVRFDSAQKPDSVLKFFRNHGFSNSQIHSIIARAPALLACDTNKRVLPKFEFLVSKGASASDVVLMVTRSPIFLRSSLENHIIPAYGLVRRFCPSDMKAMACVIACPTSISDHRFALNVKLLLDDGVTNSSIYHLLRTRPSILCSTDLRKTVEEVKELGFNPLKSSFSVALLAKRALTKSQWDAKVDAFKTWGWSEEEIFHAFRRHPNFMLRSKEKINAVMSLWVNQLGWSSSTLLTSPAIFGYSLEKRLIPRASVVQYLLSKGLMKKDASLYTPFNLSDMLFLKKFVKCFKEEETSRLLKLYQEKMNLRDNREEDGSIWQLVKL